jgi:hypothetical protein
MIALAFPIAGHQGIEVDQVRHSWRHPVGHAGDDDPAIAMSHQHDILEIFEVQDVHDIADVGGQVNVRGGEMDAFAQAGESWRVHVVSGRAQQRDNLFPAPAAVPSAVDEDKRGRRRASQLTSF